jgi:PilZ domain-containing protein
MIQTKRPKKYSQERAARRCPLVASAEVLDLQSQTRLSARTSEIGVGGCYVDALNPFPTGTRVKIKIMRDQGVFETEAKVVYSDASFGMGLAFCELPADQRSVLEDWLAEIVTQLRPA